MGDFVDDDDQLEERDDEDHVGYKNPPKQHQFKAGQSGNPKGRPKKSPTFDDLSEREGRKLVAVKTRDGSTMRIPKSEVIVRRVFDKAMQGDHRAIQMVILMEAKRAGVSVDGDADAEAYVLGSKLSPESVRRMAASYLAEVDQAGEVDDEA